MSAFVANARAVVRRAVLPLALLILTGCGYSGKGNLEGTVTYNGKALAMGSVTAIGHDKLPYVGAIEENGHYLIPDVPCGPVQLSVSSPEPGPEMPAATRSKSKKEGGGAPASATPGARPNPKWIRIPETYDNPAKSGLTTIVERGTTKHDIELK